MKKMKMNRMTFFFYSVKFVPDARIQLNATFLVVSEGEKDINRYNDMIITKKMKKMKVYS